MQLIIIRQDNEDIQALEVPDDCDGGTLLQLLQLELGINVQNISIEFNDNPIRYDYLVSQGLEDGSTIIIKNKVVEQPVSSPPLPPPNAYSTSGSTPAVSSGTVNSIYDIPPNVTPEQLLVIVQANSSILTQLRGVDDKLAEVLTTLDLTKIRTFMMKRALNKHKMEFERQQEFAAYDADPMNPELQAKLEENVSAIKK
jgi:hypothetical protein